MNILKPAVTAGIVLLALYFMPFVTVKTNDASGRSWRVPFGTWFVSDNGQDITFRGLRSAYSLGKDSENVLHSGEEIRCYGKTYYYQSDKDVSLSGYDTGNGLVSSVTYHYQPGNACLGWTGDDEVAWELGPLSEADPSISPEAAAEKEWFVIQDGKALNPGIYNDFSRLVKQGVYSILRTMVTENGEVTFTDIQLLENPKKVKNGENEQDAYYCVRVLKNGEVSENYYTRYSETAETDPRIVSVYHKDAQGQEHETVLFTYRVK